MTNVVEIREALERRRKGVRFEGEVCATWVLEDGIDTLMRLDRPVTFFDSSCRKWVAPAGLLFDGASIPQALWPLVGSPFTGNYRRAAVLHDAAYQLQESTREEADRMFYDAMIADDVRRIDAWVMWKTVRAFGGWAWKSKGKA